MEELLVQFQRFLDSECSELANDQYKELLNEIISECQARVLALYEDEEE